MLIAIRISGQVNIPNDKKETLYRLRLRKKYSAVLLHPTQQNLKRLKTLRNYISYGIIDEETLEKLIQKRAKSLTKEKIDVKKIMSQLDKKNLKDLNVKSFFSLHPPLGGIESKKHAGVGKGVLGENKKINDIVRRML